MPLLDGVRIGPLDPDRGENFGQVGGQSTARQLIRHHTRMHPPALAAALRRIRQDERSDAIDKAEAEEHIRDYFEEAGESLPEESRIRGLAVRGADDTPEQQVVTFTFTTPSGRTGKGFVPYRDLPRSVGAGNEAVRIRDLKEAGLPWSPSEAAREVAGIRGTGVADTSIDDTLELGELREENDELRDERDELKRRLDEMEQRLREVEGQRETTPASAGGGSGVESSPQTPEGGSAEVTGTVGPEDDEESREGGGAPEDSGDALGQALGLPVSYDGARAQDVRAKLRETRDAGLAERVLAYEQRPDGGQNRATVVAAANEVLDHSGPQG